MCPRNCISGTFAIFDARSHGFACPKRQNGPHGRRSRNFRKRKKFCLVNVKSFVSKCALGIAFRGHLPFSVRVRTRSRVQNDKTALTATGAGIFENEKNFV